MTRRSLTVIACCLGLASGLACQAKDNAPPNVLLVMVDDLNSDIGAFGNHHVRTPHIDTLASRGVVFTRAYTQYPQCNQSRTSLLSGLYPDQTQVLDLKAHFRESIPDVVTLPQHFRNQGYFTARVGKIFHQGVPTEIGSDGLDDPASWDVVINPRGVDLEYDEAIVSIVPPEEDKRRFGGTLSWLALDRHAGLHTDEIGANEAIRLLKEHHPAETGKPFFLALGFYRPHTPFIAPEAYFDMYPTEHIELPSVPAGDRENKPTAALADRKYQAQMTRLQKRQVIQAYHASISFIDAQLGRVVSALDALDLSRNTVVVFVSDHGYQLGAHGLWQKRDLFENSARTPLLIVAPGQLEAGRSDMLVELVDIYPTLVSLSGQKKPDSPLQGRDLKAVLDGREAARELALSQSWSAAYLTRPKWRGKDIMGYSIRTDRYRYTEWGGGEFGVELYDYQQDPQEFDNLAANEEFSAVVAGLRQLLEDKLASIKTAE